MNIKKLIFPLISLIVLTSCDSSSSKPSELFHMHTFNEEWKSDETGHWKETTCEHDIKTNKEDHIYNTKVTEPTYETKGFTTYTCSVCNYSYESDYIDALKHNYSNKWSYDGNKHYHACIDEGYKDLRKDEENHNYNENGICKECTFSVFSLYQDIYNFEYKFEGEDVILLGVKDTSVTDITIPDCFTVIGDSAFKIEDKKGLTITSMSIPSTITRIESQAFAYTTINCDLVIPDSVVSLGKSCFDTSTIQSISLSNNLEVIPYECFHNAKTSSLVLPSSIKTIEYAGFRGCYVDEVSLNEGLETVGDWGLNFSNLKEISLPDTITSLGYVPLNEYYLKKVKFSGGIKEVEKSFFYDFVNLECVIFPEGVEKLGTNVFNSRNTKMKYLYLPLSLKELYTNLTNLNVYYNGTTADWFNIKFEGDQNPLFYANEKNFLDEKGESYCVFKKIYISEGVTELSLRETSAFGYPLEVYNYPKFFDVYLPKSLTKIVDGCIPARTIFYQSTLDDWFKIETPDKGTIYHSSVFNTYDFGDYFYFKFYCMQDGIETYGTNLVIPTNVKEIPRYKLYGFVLADYIEIPESVESIGDLAFSHVTETEAIRFTNASIKIGEYAFSSCKDLRRVYIDNPNDEIMDIEENAFRWCSKFSRLIYNGTQESFKKNEKLLKALRVVNRSITVYFPDETTYEI